MTNLLLDHTTIKKKKNYGTNEILYILEFLEVKLNLFV